MGYIGGCEILWYIIRSYGMPLQEVSLQTIWNWNLEARKKLKKKQLQKKPKESKKNTFGPPKGHSFLLLLALFSFLSSQHPCPVSWRRRSWRDMWRVFHGRFDAGKWWSTMKFGDTPDRLVLESQFLEPQELLETRSFKSLRPKLARWIAPHSSTWWIWPGNPFSELVFWRTLGS